MEDIILDTDLAGFSVEDVELTYEDRCLALVAARQRMVDQIGDAQATTA